MLLYILYGEGHRSTGLLPTIFIKFIMIPIVTKNDLKECHEISNKRSHTLCYVGL
jgi:hypothetical protein